MNIRPIRNDNDHEQALARLTTLLERDPAPESDASAELEVLTTLIEQYEAKHYPIATPTPVAAIRFRMDQLGLRNKDLVPYIGSASKVSEVLNGKRPLSLAMIRKLHRHLDIPAEVLIQNQSEPEDQASDRLEPSAFPVKTMYKRGYFKGAPARWADAGKKSAALLEQLMADAGIREAGQAYCRSTAHYRDGKTLDNAALLAWQARVLVRARERDVRCYTRGAVDEVFMDRVAAISIFDEGPRLAREFLEKHGIAVVIEPHLPKTYLDGAAFLREDGSPVIGLTLRHDKLDNFWFTLLHELAHVSWHLAPERSAIFDDLAKTATDEIEREADAKATETLIPQKQWRFAAVRESQTAEDARSLAQTVQRHPAVIVGRLQRETDNYRLLAKSVGIGRGQVRCQFEEFQD